MKSLPLILLLGLLAACSAKNNPEPEPNLGFENVVYNPVYTRIVTVSGSNVLVRGSFPCDARGNFVYDSILAYVMAKVPGISFDQHSLIDVSVIDNQGDAANLSNELFAYGLPDSVTMISWPPFTVGYKASLLGTQVCGHPGHFLWWPFEGYNPDNMSWEQKVGQFFTADGYNGQPGGYDFNGLTDRIDSLLTDETYPKIIYYHCTFGKDRTGALTFAWLVKHGGFSKEAAKSKVDSVVVPNAHYSAMMEDYWTWLHP